MGPASHPLRSRTVTVIALAVITAAAMWLLTRPHITGSDGSSARSRPGAQISAATSGHAPASRRESPRTSPEEGVVLPGGSKLVNGLPTRFPYTDLGAVATQVAVSRAQIGFDYDTAITAVRTYATTQESAVFVERARLAIGERCKAAGVPTNVPAGGEAPAPASYAVTPVAYHLQQLGTDYYAVTLLSYITLTTTSGTSKDGFYSGTQLVRWVRTKAGGDWKLTQGSNADVRKVLDADRPKPAAPGSETFKSEGWIQLNAEQS